MNKQTKFRCAVYTRKSHEEGLDQEFNSLDAQAESCKAYIASQAGLGWKLRDAPYDDGGISGGHMDRPGLQQLIKNIKAGLIDVIVVYKVDRLTRSLTDFAKLVDVFDEHGVSFVSVTQAFNTTTSMGRLTLNVLLSFAQFEREVTAERIRDKTAASKAKRLWMGGNVPLGYRNEDKKLYIRDDEAKTVHLIFELYLKHKNVRLLKGELDERNTVSRKHVLKSGKQTGGCPLSRGLLYRILTNSIYIGKIQHKDKIYEGQHEAIITKSIWDQVKAILKTNAIKRTTIGNSKSPTLLAGLLFDGEGNKLVPHHVSKKGTRYHYYVSQRLKTGDQDSGWRIPAKTIERIVMDTLISSFGSTATLLELMLIKNTSADKIQHISTIGISIRNQIEKSTHMELKVLFNDLVDTITLQTNQISIAFKSRYFAKRFGIKLTDHAKFTLVKPMSIRRRDQEMKIVIDGQEPIAPSLDNALIKLVARAYALRAGLEDGSIVSIKDFAEVRNIDHADAKRMLPLGYLAPDIVETILKGQQPIDLTALSLKNGYNLPTLWMEQRAQLGFPN